MKNKLKTFNVFYTDIPTEHELLVQARTLKEATQKVKDFFHEQADNIRGGWEIKDTECKKKI